MTLYKPLARFIDSLQIETISDERKEVLQKLADYLRAQKASNKPIALTFICIHNSRRSQLAQVWAQSIASYFGHSDISCFSGGTEATALYPQIAATLKATGFKILKLRDGENPIFQIKYATAGMPIIGFSKKYDDSFNPTADFAAVMVCDAADEACPLVRSANVRLSITYDDPKIADPRPDKAPHYLERSKQIATEMKWVFSQLKYS